MIPIVIIRRMYIFVQDLTIYLGERVTYQIIYVKIIIEHNYSCEKRLNWHYKQFYFSYSYVENLWRMIILRHARYMIQTAESAPTLYFKQFWRIVICTRTHIVWKTDILPRPRCVKNYQHFKMSRTIQQREICWVLSRLAMRTRCNETGKSLPRVLT